jgi:hypothetical protein
MVWKRKCVERVAAGEMSSKMVSVRKEGSCLHREKAFIVNGWIVRWMALAIPSCRDSDFAASLHRCHFRARRPEIYTGTVESQGVLLTSNRKTDQVGR